MKKVQLNSFSAAYQKFVNASKTYENNKYGKFLGSYVSTCSNGYVRRMKSHLTEKYEKLREGYEKIDEWWNQYINDIRSVENVISQSNYGFEDSELSSFVTGKFVNPKVTKTSISGKLSIVLLGKDLGTQGASTTPYFAAQAMMMQKLSLAKNQRELILNKYFKGEKLSAAEVNKIQSTLTHMYDDELSEVQSRFESSSKEYEQLQNDYYKITGSKFDLKEVQSLKEDAKNGDIGNWYQRYDSMFQTTDYKSLDAFVDKIVKAQNQYYQDLNQKNQMESQVKGLSYALISQTKDYQSYSTNSIAKGSIDEAVTIIQNDQNIAVPMIYANYSTYAQTHKNVDPLTFTIEAMKEYGDQVEIQGVANGDLLKELAKVQSVDSLKDMGKYYSFAYQNFGESDASKYLKDYETEIHQFCGEVNAREFLDSLTALDDQNRTKAVTNHLKITGKGLGEGILGFFNNLGYMVESAFSENRTVSAQEYENMYIVEALSNEKTKLESGFITENKQGSYTSTSDIIDYTKDYGAFTEHNYQISQSIGNMLPSMAITAINPFAGSLTLGTSAAGGSYHSAMTEGYSRGKSLLYGAASGASEVLLEKALGGLPLMSDTQVTSLKTMAKAMGKEFGEEFTQSYVDGLAGTLILQKDFNLGEVTQDAIQSGIYGGITGGIMNIPSLALNSSSIRSVEREVNAGNVTKDQIVQSFHELFPETASMNYQEILEEYSHATKEVTLNLVQESGKSSTSSGATTLFGNLFHAKNQIGSLEGLSQSLEIDSQNIQSIENDLTKSKVPGFSQALKSSLDNVTAKIRQYYSEDIDGVVTKKSVTSIPKAALGVASSVPNLILKGIYQPVTQNASVSNKVLNEGLYHITDLDSASKILDSGYVKASNALASLGTPKGFFFAGKPSFEDIAINLLSVDKVQTAVKIDVSSNELASLDYRAYDDGAVTHKGDLHFNPDQAHLVYLGLDIDENGNLYYKEISQDEYTRIKETTEDNVLTKVSNELKSIFVAMAAQADIMKNNLKNAGENLKIHWDMLGDLEPALVGVDSLPMMEQVISENSNVRMMLGKTALSSLPKAAASLVTSFTSAPFFFRYVPVTTSASFSQKILNEGLYHFTSEKSIAKIQESGYIKASDYVSSYGNKKSFFFAGIPNISDLAMNTGNLAEKQIAIKVDVSQDALSQFRYRDLVDEAVSYDGNYILEDGHYSVVYLGLTEENGQLSYKEISKEEYDHYQSNVSSNKISALLQKAETVIIGLASDWSYSKRRLQKLMQVFANTKVEETQTVVAEAHSILPEVTTQESVDATVDEDMDVVENSFIDIREKELQQFKKRFGEELAQAAWDVHEDAVAKEPNVTRLLQTFESEDTELVGLDHKFKSVERLAEKIQRYAVVTDNSYADVGKTMNDALRYTFQISRDQYATKVSQIINSLIDQGCSISYFKNSWGQDTYQGINTQVITPDGVDFELQFHTQDSFEAKEKNHPYYEIYQNSKSTAKQISEAKKAMAANQFYVRVPPSMDVVDQVEKKAKYLYSATKLFDGFSQEYLTNFKDYVLHEENLSLSNDFSKELFSPQNYEFVKDLGIVNFSYFSDENLNNFAKVYQADPYLAKILLGRSYAENLFTDQKMARLQGRYELYNYKSLDYASQKELDAIYQLYDQVEDKRSFVRELNQIHLDKLSSYLTTEQLVANASDLSWVETLIDNLNLPKLKQEMDELYDTLSLHLRLEHESTDILDRIKNGESYSLSELPLKILHEDGSDINFYAKMSNSYRTINDAFQKFLNNEDKQLIRETIPFIKSKMKLNEKLAFLNNTSYEDLKTYQQFMLNGEVLDDKFLVNYKDLHQMCKAINFYQKNSDAPWKKYLMEQTIRKGNLMLDSDFEFLDFAIQELEGYVGTLKFANFPQYVLDALFVSEVSNDPKENLKAIINDALEKSNFTFQQILKYKSNTDREVPTKYKSFSLKSFEGIKEMGEYYGDAGSKVYELFRAGNTATEVFRKLTNGKFEFQDFLSDTIEGRFLKKLTKWEIQDLVEYTRGGFNIVNSALRKKSLNSATQKMVDSIDCAIAKYGGIEEATEFFRAVSVNSFTKQNPVYAELFEGVDQSDLNQVYATLKMLEGCTLSDKGYMSSSPCYSTSFAKDISYPVVLDIIAEEGTEGAYINQISEFYNKENEFLFKRDTKLKMVKVFPPAEDVNGLRKIVIQCIIDE